MCLGLESKNKKNRFGRLLDDFLDILHGVVLAMPNRSTADTTTTLGPVALALLGLCLGSERLFFLLSLILSFMITLPLLFLLFCRKKSCSGFFLFLILAFLLVLAFALACQRAKKRKSSIKCNIDFWKGILLTRGNSKL